LTFGLYLLVGGVGPFREVLAWFRSLPRGEQSFPPVRLLLGISAASVAGGLVVLALTAATVLPRRLRGWLAYLLLVLGVLVCVVCFLWWGAGDPRSWVSAWPAALVLVRLGAQMHGGPSGRRVFWTAAALAAVVALAPLAAWLAYHQVAAPSKGELVQTSVSPGERWEVRTYSVSDAGLGPDSGLLRVDVRDLRDSPGRQRTVYVDSAENADMDERQIRWLDADLVSISEEFGGSFQVDVAHDRAEPPAEFMSGIAGLAAAFAAFIGVLVVGLLAILLVVPLLMARQAVRALPEGGRP
jgi:hypothetical protein